MNDAACAYGASVLLCVLLAGTLACVRPRTLGTLGSVASMALLSAAELREGRPVTLDGDVTLYDAGLGLLVVQGETGGVPIALPARMHDVQEGDRVTIDGFTGYEGFRPVVVKATLRSVGRGGTTPIGTAPAAELLRGDWDYRLTAIECRIVALVGSQTGHFTLSAEIAGHPFHITGSGAQTSTVHRLFGRHAVVRGIPITTYSPSGEPHSLRIYTGTHRPIELLPERGASRSDATIPRAGPEPGLPLLSQIEQVKSLPNEEAERGYPVQVRGVVTGWDTDRINFFMQDETAAVYVLPMGPLSRTVARGDVVEARGVTGRGGFAPVVYCHAVRVLGRGRLPEPRNVDLSRTLSSRDENAWVEIEGVVLAARHTRPDATDLHVRHGPVTTLATLQVPLEANERRALVNTRVRARGTLSPLFASDGRLTGANLLVPAREELDVIAALAGDSLESPARAIRTVLGYSPEVDRPHRVKVEGHIVFAGFGGDAYLMDETGGLRLRDLSGGAVDVGDAIVALGFVEPLGVGARMTWVEVEPATRPGSTPRPHPAAAADLHSGLFEGELVEVDGFLRSRRQSYGDRIFELDAGRVSFTAILEQPRSCPEWTQLREGALLRLTGVSRVEWDTDRSPPAPAALHLLLRSPQDVIVLRSAPWWTLRRAAVAAASLLGALLLAAAWVGTLRRRVRAQKTLLVKQMEQRKALEETLRESQRLESLGQLAGGVAHDFNNILVVIGSYSHLLMRELRGQDKALSWVEQIKKAGERAAMLTRQLLAVSRRQILRPLVVDLNALVTDLDEMLRRLLGEDIQVVAALAPGTLAVRVDPGQMGQVILNLCVNARDAMPEGGRLTVATSAVRVDGAGPDGVPGAAPGDYACLSVSDTGTGMDEETRARIFEPFFTTKRAGAGTGLGLATAFGIVKQSGGHMSVSSRPGHGTTFEVHLPRILDGRVERPPALPDATNVRGAETVLVVEDDAAVRGLAQDSLSGFGYTVLSASNGEEALVHARRHTGPIDILVTDVVLPGMNGRRLADRLAAERPLIRTLFISGYTHNIIAHKGVLDSGTHFLAKPFTPSELGAAVRRALGQRETAGERPDAS